MRFIYHQNPDEAVRDQCRYLEQIRKTEGQTAYWNLTRDLLKTDPWFLMRVGLEWGWLDDQLVGHHFVKHIADNWGEDLAILFPRGHGKTLPMSAMCIAMIVNDPNIAILEISRTQDNANKIGNFIADQLMGNDYLQRCFSRKHNPDTGFLPSKIGECNQWGKDGYVLPWRKPRIDPTLLCIPIKGAKAGKHPDKIWIDDPTEAENNNEPGWEQVVQAVMGCWFMLAANGSFFWTGTRWHDADPLGQAELGKLQGKKGPFRFIKYSCYEEDDPGKAPTYPYKVRWNMTEPTGYTHSMLEAKRRPEDEGGFGEFFDAQMRNDPSPAERSDIKVAHINIFEPHEMPKIGHVRIFGIENSGGGLVIYNGFREHCEKLRFSVPLQDISNPRKSGVSKRDRIVAALQPLVDSGKFYAQQWMIGQPGQRDTLGYELRRIGKAAHDDIADAVHNAVVHLSAGIKPVDASEPMHLYIMADMAYTEEKRSDWSVVAAVAVDHHGAHWVVDYVRFQCSSPTGIYDHLLEFYRKFEEPQSIRQQSGKKFPGAWR